MSIRNAMLIVLNEFHVSGLSSLLVSLNIPSLSHSVAFAWFREMSRLSNLICLCRTCWRRETNKTNIKETHLKGIRTGARKSRIGQKVIRVFFFIKDLYIKQPVQYWRFSSLIFEQNSRLRLQTARHCRNLILFRESCRANLPRQFSALATIVPSISQESPFVR